MSIYWRSCDSVKCLKQFGVSFMDASTIFQNAHYSVETGQQADGSMECYAFGIGGDGRTYGVKYQIYNHLTQLLWAIALISTNSEFPEEAGAFGDDFWRDAKLVQPNVVPQSILDAQRQIDPVAVV